MKVSKRLSDSPALVTDHESGSLRKMMKLVVSCPISIYDRQEYFLNCLWVTLAGAIECWAHRQRGPPSAAGAGGECRPPSGGLAVPLQSLLHLPPGGRAAAGQRPGRGRAGRGRQTHASEVERDPAECHQSRGRLHQCRQLQRSYDHCGRERHYYY